MMWLIAPPPSGHSGSPHHGTRLTDHATDPLIQLPSRNTEPAYRQLPRSALDDEVLNPVELMLELAELATAGDPSRPDQHQAMF